MKYSISTDHLALLAMAPARDVLVQGQDGFAPNDAADLPTFEKNGDVAVEGFGRAFEVAEAGDVRVTTLDGNPRTIPAVVGRVYQVCFVRLHNTGTTATGILVYV